MPAHSGKPWTPVAKRDTTPDVAARQDAWWQSLSGPDRARWWMQYQWMIAVARRAVIKKQQPGANDREVMALWVEETYRGRADTDPAWLARACAAIRAGENSGVG